MEAIIHIFITYILSVFFIPFLSLPVVIALAISIATTVNLTFFDIVSGQVLTASTRGLFNPQTGEISEELSQEFLNASAILGLDDAGRNCPGEIAI